MKLVFIHSPQNTMTESTILLEDVQKMKDRGEIAQAYVGLKETNKYVFPGCTGMLFRASVCGLPREASPR